MPILTLVEGLLTDPLKEARADLCSALEELQRLLREPSRDGCWQARWMEAHSQWAASHARWQMLRDRRN